MCSRGIRWPKLPAICVRRNHPSCVRTLLHPAGPNATSTGELHCFWCSFALTLEPAAHRALAGTGRCRAGGLSPAPPAWCEGLCLTLCALCLTWEWSAAPSKSELQGECCAAADCFVYTLPPCWQAAHPMTPPERRRRRPPALPTRALS